MTSSQPKPGKRTYRWADHLQPFALVALGGLLTLLGQCSTSYSELSRFKYESALNRRTEAMQFLDVFSTTMAARIYAASDYYSAVGADADNETLKLKRDDFFAKRRDGILQEGVFISRGADYFGPEFKDTLYKELFVVLQELDVQVQIYANTKSLDDAKKFEELETKANLLCGILLGTASRRMEGSELKPPSLHS
jgi:hypothetical protein